MPGHTSHTLNRASAADQVRVARLKNQVRTVITLFVMALLATVALGWAWTTTHQPPPLRAAAHVVLGIAALCGIFAIAKIWRQA